ncbi:MAG: UDP-N-acetylglucosamine--N-acetylmuramyl-(pentapeptide) pyrophosphoryl-undecaprenol N-acetylglucosamine transferase [Anaerolineales bacterium]
MYPALAVLQTMQNKAEVLWVGGEGGMEAQLVARANVPFKTIPAAGIHGVGLKSLPGNIARLVRGYFASRRILHEFNPDVMFFTGGYVAVPIAIAGRRIPMVLYVPDIEPALALKTLARFADKIAVTSPDSFRYFKHPDRLVLTGYPTRPELAKWTRSAGHKTLGLSEDLPVLLVFGGSKGARSINEAVLSNLPTLLELVQIIHITGELDWSRVEARAKEITSVHANRYHVFPYLHDDMGAALAASDLVISRAGASALGEYPLFGLPAVLVPYPYAWRYQKVNADSLVQQGAAIMLEDDKLSDQIVFVVSDLLGQPIKLASMRNSMQRLSRQEAASEIANQLFALCQERS